MSNPIFKKNTKKVFIKAKEVRELIDSAEDLMQIVEGVRCQEWRSASTDMRLKDTMEWVKFYVAVKNVLRE
jgi:hypothetical protein